MAEVWSITNKVCIVTGSNSGIGRVTALELAKRGAAKVILACRNVQAADEAAKDIREKAGLNEVDGAKKVVVKQLDLASLESVRRFAADVIATEPALHVLVNNAGLESPNQRQLTVDGYEQTFATNHLGPFLLTNLLTDLLKKSAPSRVICVASKMHKATWPKGFDTADVNQEYVRSYNGTKAYSQSKLANVLFAGELHRRLNGEQALEVGQAPSSGVSVFSLHPGLINSGFLRHRSGCSLFMAKIIFLGAITVEQGALTSLHCACQPNIEHLSGKYFDESKPQELWALGKDTAKAKQLWEISEQLVAAASSKK